MKKLASLLLFVLFLSCREKPTSEEISGASIPQNSVEVNLEKNFLPLTINMPNQVGENVEINEINGSSRIKLGNIFHIEIAYGGDLIIKKQDLKDDAVFKNEIISETDDLIFYSSSLKDNSKIYYHFYAVKNIEGETYEIFDVFDETEFKKGQIENMIKYVNTIRSSAGIKAQNQAN